MDVNGGGYTFIKPTELQQLTNAEIQAAITDTTTVLLRTKHAIAGTGSIQKYGVLKQLDRYE